MVKRLIIGLAVALFGVASGAQPSEVVYTDSFDGYGLHANPSGWIDTSIGQVKPEAEGLFKTWPDPLGSANVVYGTKQSSGRPEGSQPRIGAFSTLTTKAFSSEGRFEYRGRFLRDDARNHIGLAFLSSYPERDSYYLIGTWSDAMTMQLSAFGAGTIEGSTDSGFSPEAGRWWRFAIVVDDADAATRIRARFWADGTQEPDSFAIDAIDRSAARLREGRIGIWSAVKGGAYFDDLFAKSPVDHTPPSIAFFDAETPLANDAVLNHDARVDVRATDDVSGVASVEATLDGVRYVPLTPVTTEARHVVRARATDHAGNTAAAEVAFHIDKTPPRVDVSVADGFLTNQDVTPVIAVTDLTPAPVQARLDGVEFKSGTTVTAEGTHSLLVTAVDAAGWRTDVGPIVFTIDRTPPAIAVTSHTDGQRVAMRNVIVSGTAGDAVRIVVNGADAALAAGVFTSAPVELLESENEVRVEAFDAAGNRAAIALGLVLDTSAPELRITAPSAGDCVAATEIVVRGTVVDQKPSVSVRANNGTAVAAVVAGTEWTATVPLPEEGDVILSVIASDDLGHATTSSVPLQVDRTSPVVTMTERGVPFTATLLNRAVAPDIRSNEGTLAVTLDGVPYVSGTVISEEGSHVLRAIATDCANQQSDPVEHAFTIDTTPPAVVSIHPASGTHVGSKPQLTGTLSEPATLTVEASDVVATIDGVTFTVALPLHEGTNTYAFVVTDRAGNTARVPYTLEVTTIPPAVEIVENGLPLSALYNRAIVPVIRVSDPAATASATLNGSSFTSGSSIARDGEYTLIAKATDAFGHASDEARASFTIDRTAPRVTITSPAAGAVADDVVEVRGTIDEAASVTVNGIAATVNGTTFVVSVRLDGDDGITAAARDRAGNVGNAHVEVRHEQGPLAIFLTAPADGALTNRSTTLVAGQVLTMPPSGTVSVNGTIVPLDPAGAFRIPAFPLTEGANTIAATVVNEGGATNQATASIVADFTPPSLHVLANGAPLVEGGRFSVAPEIEVTASDDATLTLAIDGSTIDGAVPLLANGGHTLSAVARDAATNEARIDRTFVIGEGVTASGCALNDITPADGTAVFDNVVHISGRSGGAASVLINGNAAQIADGSFCGDATLEPGRNEITIRCADAAGNPTADAPIVRIYWRESEAEVKITPPAPRANGTITVNGTVPAGAISGDVNGAPMTIDETAFTAPGVVLTPGLNVLAARVKTAAGRAAIGTARVKSLSGPPQIVITSPMPGTTTGSTSIDVSGTYVNVDPISIRANNAAVTTIALSDTSGTFHGTVPLANGSTNTIRVTGANDANVADTAEVGVSHVMGAPSVAISEPVDNTHVSSSRVHVSGTIAAEAGAQVQVNGITAVLNGSAFSADVDAAATGTPIIARVVTPDGDESADIVRIIRFATPLSLERMFPEPNATDVDRGVAVVLKFNNALDASSVANGVHLADPTGATVPGETYVDRDAVTFAPLVPLEGGRTYTVTLATSLADAAGGRLPTAQTFSFRTATSAPATAPLVDDLVTSGCLRTMTLTGRASTGGARVRLEVDGVKLHTTAADTGAYKFKFAFSGPSGFHIVRVREIGADGSLSAERAICFRVNCELPHVVSASLDREARTLTIDFSREMDPASLIVGETVLIEPLAGTLAYTAQRATISITSEVPDSVTLIVRKDAKDASGASMAADFTQTFTTDGSSGVGRGVVSGAVYDATNGRPLANATVRISGVRTTTDSRGRYSRAVGEGAFTIEAGADGYTSVWRQVVVPAGSGAVPIDIRPARRGPAADSGTSQTLTDGGDTSVTVPVVLTIGAASLPPGHKVRVTSVGAQSLAGLLPLGWSPLAAAEIAVDDAADASAIPGATLRFSVDTQAIRASSQTISFVRYDDERDEWRVVVAVANADEVLPILESGNYALVYPDAASHLTRPPASVTGQALRGVAPCAGCALRSRSFTLAPTQILPNGRAVATLVTEGKTQTYPSGTAVKATIDEQLNLADGRVLVDPPFATDLLVYRTLDGASGVAAFHLAPTPQAAAVMLRDGVEHIHITDYPGRVDRGSLIGPEGGRVPGDGAITIDVPPNATSEPIHATATAIDAGQLPNVEGFRVAGGFTLTLTRAGELPPADGVVVLAPSFLVPARATFRIDAPEGAQVIVGEVVASTSLGPVVRVVAIADRVSGGLYSTRAIDSTQLPLDGVVRDGRYVILVANAPVAFAFGQVRLGADGVAVADARVSANGLGTTSLTSLSGTFALPVLAKPAAPFSLVARTAAIGDGAPLSASSAPEPGAFVDAGVLPLTPRPPRLRAVSPDGTTIPAATPLVVTAEFDSAIDAASVTNGLRVTNLTTGVPLAGAVTAAGALVSFSAHEPLRAAAQYAITIAPTIRSSTGAPFGQTVVKTFRTEALPRDNASIDPRRIRITLPDANGKVVIRGLAGALPAGAQALAVRRGTAFIEMYQATVTADGSFTFDAGHGHARDRITTSDLIDLQVIDGVSHAIIAVIELTPFVSDDGRSFLASPNRTTRFVSADGIAVTVPAGAFASATLVTVMPAARTALAQVPGFDQELVWATGVDVRFDGVAQKRIELEMPIPANTDTSRPDWLLGMLSDSVRGPRVMIVDTLRVSGSTFTTTLDSSSAGLRPASNAVITGPELRNALLGVTRSAVYSALQITPPVRWAVLDGLQYGCDLFFDTVQSLYAAHFYLTEARGRIVVPLPTDRAFEIVGVDAGTGLDSFRRVYDPLAPGDPRDVVALPNPNPDRQGPYPINGSPFRIESLDVDVADIDITSLRDFTVRLANGWVTVSAAIPNRVTLMNVSTGAVDRGGADGLRIPATLGDRIILLVEERDVDAYAPLSVVFSEPLGDVANLSDWFALETAPAAGGTFVAVAARMQLDSGGRRLQFDLPASLNRLNRYRVVLRPQITDGNGLTIGAPGAPLTEPLYLEFDVRDPGDRLASFDIASGAIRDQALNGNVLFVSALEGGLFAYDVADPAGMTASTEPLARTIDDGTAYWAVASDHHNRVYSTGLHGMFGVVRSFRLEDFLRQSDSGVTARATGITSWAPGSSSALGLASGMVMSDRVEAIPRKLQILLQDDTVADGDRAEFIDATRAETTAVIDDFLVLSASFARNPQLPYAVQRVTVENLTLDLRWSADATASRPAVITGILARAGDRLRVIRNRTTYGVVSLFGYGVGVFDLNAIESNDASDKPAGYETLAEQIRVTNAAWQAVCGEPAPDAIPDLTYTPDAAIVTRAESPDLHVFAIDAARGMLDLTIHPPTSGGLVVSDEVSCDERAPIGLVFPTHPRLAELRSLFEARTGREPFGRFTGASMYHWRLEAQDNARGERGSETGTTVERDYVLVPGNEYGLLVVEVGGNPAPLAAQSYTPLQPLHLADVIWIPHGARAVRVIPRTRLATVVDGLGYVLLVDLSRIDERWGIEDDTLFPTVASILATDVESPDPRIVWRSAEPIMAEGGTVGTLAPVADSDTGFVYAGRLLAKSTNVVAAIDPRVQIKVDAGSPNGLSEVGGVVPLGIDPPAGVLHSTPDASLAAFRVELALPGAIADSLGGALLTDIVSERVPGAASDEMPAGYPRSHLRGVALQRAIPAALAAQLRHQKGFNRFISPWVVAIADPRASEDYVWPTGLDRTVEGCASCVRPQRLRGDASVRELYTNGRLIALSPRIDVLAGSGYEYLANARRLETRFATIMADTVRPPAVRVPAQNAAIAGGMLQETTYLHSGEIETSNVDLVAGGRAGWDVEFDRAYRSRSIGGTALGQGWDSSMFRRLRALPNGDVEYRDGSGEIWLFRSAGGAYQAPEGLFLNLTRNDRGWLLVDQRYRITAFDSYGRLVHETDEFAESAYTTTSGNVIRYLYDSSGRLAAIVDPVGRTSRITYETGTVTVRDWRDREVTYHQDALGRLTSVELPRVDGRRPTLTYAYEDGSGTNDLLELATNLKTVTDPASTRPRVTFAYARERDRISGQTWGTGETASFQFFANGASTTDALRQQRSYILESKRVRQLDELDVEGSSAPFGTVPSNVSAAAPPRASGTRTFDFTYTPAGLLDTVTLRGVHTTRYAYVAAPGSAPGSLVDTVTTTPAAGGDPVVRDFDYRGTLLKRASANGLSIELAPVDGRQRQSEAANDFNERVSVDAAGLLRSITTNGGNDGIGVGTNATFEYEPADGPLHARGLLQTIDRGGLLTRFAYPSMTRTETTDPEGVTTTTDLDEWLRPKTIVTTGPGLRLESTTGYDANGRVERTSRKQSGRTMTETFEYDDVGRLRKTSADNVAVSGTEATLESSIEYDLPNRRITRTLPSGAVITELLDGLGRVKTRTTTTGAGPDLREELVYDLAGNVVFSANNHVATVAAHDAHGCATLTLYPDGTKTSMTCDAWGRAEVIRRHDENDGLLAETRPSLTPAGSLLSMTTKVDETRNRTSEWRWDGAGRVTRTATDGRVAHQTFDAAGRLLSAASGSGSLASMQSTFDSATFGDFSGVLPRTTQFTERGATPVTSRAEYDTLANVVRQSVGSLEWKRTFDEAANLVAAQEPARPEARFDYDALGNLTRETKADQSAIAHQYDATGAAKEYRDEAGEPTGTVNDRLGRPLERTYADGTSETFTYDGERVQTYKDREGRSFTYEYNAKGQVAQVRATGGEVLEEFEYDAGRVKRCTTRDAALVYENFDLEGRPRRTRQIRYRDHSGFSSREVLDEYVQEHEWSVHGERNRWTMPAPPNATLAAGWTSEVSETRDAVGNVEVLQRTIAGAASASTLMEASYRNAGRPISRTLTTPASASIVRTYGYDEETGQLDDLTVTAQGVVVAGSRVTHDGVQIGAETLHGVSGERRRNEFGYDERSRLATSRFAREEGSGVAMEVVSPADFRLALDRPQEGAAAQPSLAFTESDAGHRIATMTRGGESRVFSYDGSQRVDDGRFVYEFDARGRLTRATEKPRGSASGLRRIEYEYAGSNRVVGRRAWYGRDDSWQPENRPDVLAADGIPAHATFVWDPIADVLVAVADADTGALVRQVIHGGNSYDDPLEIAIGDAAGVHRLYPVFDEAGTSTLQVMLSEQGEVVSRAVTEGGYGEDEFAIAGPAVDRIEVEAKKKDDGTLESVSVSLRITEAVDPATIPSGARLAATTRTGTVVRSSPSQATLFDNYTLRWTLTADEWTALTAPAESNETLLLSIAATRTLRAAAWPADAEILGPPAWAATTEPLYSSPSLAVEYREPIASLTSWLSSIASSSTSSTTLYAVPALAALGDRTPAGGWVVGGGFQALPFTEPMTGHVYVRARWYDPGTGSFLSPDPKGYVDSSNLYAFAGGDPVNGRDPTGTEQRISKQTAANFGELGSDLGEIVDAVGNKLRRQAQLIDRLGRGPHRTVEGNTVGQSGWDVETFVGNVAEGTVTSLWQFAQSASREKGRTPSEKIVKVATKATADAATRFVNANEKQQRAMLVDLTIDIEEQILLARASEAFFPSGPTEAGIQWGRGIKKQGMPWEDYLARLRPAGDRLPAGFGTFDFFSEETGLATSAKTLETLTSSRVATPKQVYYAIRKHINEAAGFTSYELSGVSLTAEDIVARELQLAVQPGTTAAQWSEIARAVEYGKSMGVKVVVTTAR